MKKQTTIALATLTGSVGAALVASVPSTDGTLALLSEGYTFIPERCQRCRSDVFETRLMLTKTVCMMGEEAAEVFYEPGRFTRKGAAANDAEAVARSGQRAGDGWRGP